MLIRCETVKSWFSVGGGKSCQVNRKLEDGENVKIGNLLSKKTVFKIGDELKLKKFLKCL